MAITDAKPSGEGRHFRRVRVDLPGQLFIVAQNREVLCTVADLSPGGAAIVCALSPEPGTQVVLYIDGFGRFDGRIKRRDSHGLGIAFVCSASRRERIAQQLILFLNKALVDDSVLRRHERSCQQGLASFTRADGGIVTCAVMDVSVGGVSLKTNLRPAVGEFVLIAQTAGRVVRHHADGIAIAFVTQDQGRASVSSGAGMQPPLLRQSATTAMADEPHDGVLQEEQSDLAEQRP